MLGVGVPVTIVQSRGGARGGAKNVRKGKVEGRWNKAIRQHNTRQGKARQGNGLLRNGCARSV